MQQNLDVSYKNLNKTKLFQFLNELCFVPFKNESLEEFIKRVDTTFPFGMKRIEALLEEKTKEHPYMQKALSKIDIRLEFLPWVISKKGLMPWHLGVFETIGKRSRIQIHPRARKSSKLFEVLMHEGIHYLRRDYESPHEELICYLASSKGLYRALGYYLISPECRVALFLSFFLNLFSIWNDFIPPSLGIGSFLLFPISYLVCRLRLRAPLKLFKTLRSEPRIQNPLALLIRLDPEEITLLVREKSLLTKMKSLTKTSFRWHFLESIYFRR